MKGAEHGVLWDQNRDIDWLGVGRGVGWVATFSDAPVFWAGQVLTVTLPDPGERGPDRLADPAARLARVIRVELTGTKAELPPARLLPG